MPLILTSISYAESRNQLVVVMEMELRRRGGISVGRTDIFPGSLVENETSV